MENLVTLIQSLHKRFFCVSEGYHGQRNSKSSLFEFLSGWAEGQEHPSDPPPHPPPPQGESNRYYTLHIETLHF